MVKDWSGPARATGGVFVASITTVSAGPQDHSSRTTTRTSYRPTLSARKLADDVVAPDNVAADPDGLDTRSQDHSWIVPPFGSRATPSIVTPPRCTTRSGPASTVGAGSTTTRVTVSVLVSAPSLTVSCTTDVPGLTAVKAGLAVSAAVRAPPTETDRPGVGEHVAVRIRRAGAVEREGLEEPWRLRERQSAVGPRVRHGRPIDGRDLDEGRRAVERTVVHDELGTVDALRVGNEQRRDGRRVGESGRARQRTRDESPLVGQHAALRVARGAAVEDGALAGGHGVARAGVGDRRLVRTAALHRADEAKEAVVDVDEHERAARKGHERDG